MGPAGDMSDVRIDPLRQTGQPVVRSVPTAVLAEGFRAGEIVEVLADLYDLGVGQVLQAIRFEMRTAQARGGLRCGPAGGGTATIRWYADEIVLRLGKLLARQRDDVAHPGHPAVPEILPGALDTEWMPVVARRRWVVLHRDRRIRTRLAELEIFRAEGLKTVWFAESRDLTPNGAVGATAAALGSVGT